MGEIRLDMLHWAGERQEKGLKDEKEEKKQAKMERDRSLSPTSTSTEQLSLDDDLRWCRDYSSTLPVARHPLVLHFKHFYN